jgi:hypothetical protein
MPMRQPLSTKSTNRNELHSQLANRTTKGSYFGCVSWLAAIGTAIAALLVVTNPNITDAIWLFSQVP